LDNIVTVLPEVTLKGESYDGVRFKEQIQNFDIGELVAASVQVPTEVQEKINGLIVLLYLSAKFRQAQALKNGSRAGPMCVSLLLQNAYTYLLGAQGEYRSIDDCFAYASGKMHGVLRSYLTRNLSVLKGAFHEALEDLKTKKLVKRRLSNCRVQGLRTPENWLRRDP